MNEILVVDPERRDQAWEERFLKSLVTTPVHVLSPDPQEGPDHWPYLMVATVNESDPKADAPDQIQNVVGWLSTRGIGLVINPESSLPDYVLSYGMVWNFRERGEFITDTTSEADVSEKFALQAGQKLWTGIPSETYLPPYVRSVIKQFLVDQGVFAPKVLMVNFNAGEAAPNIDTGYDLCFSIESLKAPAEHEHANIAEALGWFLPTHYRLSLISEKLVPGFVAL